jgi:hypothetical protein
MNSHHAPHRALGLGLVGLGAGLALNTLIGPLALDLVAYPFSETVLNETLGLEAISLVLIAPLAIVAGVLAARGHSLGSVVALGPSGYTAYMLAQYVVGPQYATYGPVIAFHLTLLIVAVGVLVGAWSAIDAAGLPRRSRRSEIGWAVTVLLMAGFAVSRWSGALGAMAGNEAVPVAPTDLTMYWSIFLLDLGLVVPASIATAIAVLRRSPWAGKALYGVVGWFALVPPSVAAMAIVKVVRDDPVANPGDTVVLAVVTLVFWTIAAVLFRPLVARPGASTTFPAARTPIADAR